MRSTLFTVLPTLMAAALVPFPTLAQNGVGGSIDDLARQIVDKSHSSDGNTIAISAFPHVDDSCSELSNFLVDELVLSLFNVPEADVQIIERSQLGRIFAELELSMSGAVDANTTQELGRIHGVDTLLVGSLTTIGDDLRINARLIDTESGRVFSAAAVNMPKTSTLEVLMERPATGGCTMTPSEQGSGAGAGSGGSAPASSGGGSISFDTGHLESFDQLVGVWNGLATCEDESYELWFNASRSMSNGVSGAFRGSWHGGWGRGEEGSYSSAPGSATLIFQPGENEAGPEFQMAYNQQNTSGRFELQLMGTDALYGTSTSENCSDVMLGRESSDEDQG